MKSPLIFSGFFLCCTQGAFTQAGTFDSSFGITGNVAQPQLFSRMQKS